jgi:hypothetical protein
MKRDERVLICTVAGVAFCLAASAVTSDPPGSPYQGIVDRNVFGLKPPPPPPDPEATKPPPPKMFLTGITTILGNKRALMKMTPPAKPGEPAKEQSFTLGEGQREGDLEVLHIDEVAGTVKVSVYGTVATLDFDNNGVKAAAAPAPGPGPAPPGFVPKPGAPGSFNPAFPTARPLRLPTPSGAASMPSGVPVTPVYANTPAGYGNPAPVYGGATPTMALGNTTVPLTGSTAPQPTPAQTAAEASASQMTADQRFLLVEAYRAKLAQEGRTHLVPPVPPTPFTSELNGGAAGGTGAGTATPAVPTLPRAPSLPPLPTAQ